MGRNDLSFKNYVYFVIKQINVYIAIAFVHIVSPLAWFDCELKVV